MAAAEQLGQHIERVDAVCAGGLVVAADGGEMLGAVVGPDEPLIFCWSLARRRSGSPWLLSNGAARSAPKR